MSAPRLTLAHRGIDDLTRDLDNVSMQLERLVRERAEIARTLSEFYVSDISMRSLQPILDLCVQLNPTLRAR
jgi:hypothetical protein